MNQHTAAAAAIWLGCVLHVDLPPRLPLQWDPIAPCWMFISSLHWPTLVQGEHQAKHVFHGSSSLLQFLGCFEQELQVQEGGLSCLSSEYRQMLSNQTQLQQSLSSGQNNNKQSLLGQTWSGDAEGLLDVHEGLDAAVDAFKQLLKNHSRLSSGTSGVNKQLISGMESLLRHQASLSQQDVMRHIASCV